VRQRDHHVVRMQGMRLDHVSYAAGPDGLAGTAGRIGALLGEAFLDGGVHPRFGTRNMVLPLAGGTYLEVVEVLDHPASDKAPFGQAVRARSEVGGGWLGWVVSVDDIAKIEARLGRESVQGNRHRPDGVELRWRQIGVRGLQSDPQLPFFVEWQSPADQHPGVGGSGGARLDTLEIAGDPHRVSDWLGNSVEGPLEDVAVEWVSPNGTPGIVAVRFLTRNGSVRI
jgi:Glyoxalase-like domain